jgi:hypothetical protein
VLLGVALRHDAVDGCDELAPLERARAGVALLDRLGCGAVSQPLEVFVHSLEATHRHLGVIDEREVAFAVAAALGDALERAVFVATRPSVLQVRAVLLAHLDRQVPQALQHGDVIALVDVVVAQSTSQSGIVVRHECDALRLGQTLEVEHLFDCAKDSAKELSTLAVVNDESERRQHAVRAEHASDHRRHEQFVGRLAHELVRCVDVDDRVHLRRLLKRTHCTLS